MTPRPAGRADPTCVVVWSGWLTARAASEAARGMRTAGVRRARGDGVSARAGEAGMVWTAAVGSARGHSDHGSELAHARRLRRGSE